MELCECIEVVSGSYGGGNLLEESGKIGEGDDCGGCLGCIGFRSMGWIVRV